MGSFRDYGKLINEVAAKGTIEWLRLEFNKLIKKWCKDQGIPFDKKAMKVSYKMYIPSNYYRDKFYITPVNRDIVIIKRAGFVITYNGYELFKSSDEDLLMLVGDVIKNVGNQVPAMILSKDLYFASPLSKNVHKFYKDQDNYIPTSPTAKMTYYNKATLTPEARKKLKTLNDKRTIEAILLDFEETLSGLSSNILELKVKEKPKPEKVDTQSILKVGDSIFSKNGIEFNASVIAIKGNKVTVRWSLDGNDYNDSTISRRVIKYEGDGDWIMPNWTV